MADIIKRFNKYIANWVKGRMGYQVTTTKARIVTLEYIVFGFTRNAFAN